MTTVDQSNEELRQENIRLRQQLQEWENQFNRSEERFQTWLSAIHVGILIHQNGIFRYSNAIVQEILGYTHDELQHLTFADFIHPDHLPIVQERAVARMRGEEVIERYEIQVVRKDGTYRWVDLNNKVMEFDNTLSIIVSALDITAIKQDKEERIHLQKVVIDTQEALLQEVSTPLIPISEHIVIIPLIGRVDFQRAQQIMETLLYGVAKHNAEVVLFDMTGIRMGDSQVASALIQATQAVTLLGAEVVVTGIRPEVAQTFVHLGIDMQTLATHNTLQSGMVYAMQRVKTIHNKL